MQLVPPTNTPNKNHEDPLVQARAYLENSEFQKAYALGHVMLRTHAHLPELHCILARALFHLGHYQEATVFVQEALKIDSQHLDSLITHGRVLLAREKYADAARVFEYSFCLHPSIVQTHYWWVETYRRQGKSHLLISHLAKNHSKKPATAMAIVSALLDLGDRERAFSVLHGAVTTHDQFTDYFYQFATVLADFHHYTKAARILKWLVDRDPDNEELHNTWLQVLWKQGNLKAIRAASILATDRFPNNPDFNQIRFEAQAQSESVAPQEVEQANKRFAIRYSNSRPLPTHPTRYQHEKPRIAYIAREDIAGVILPVLNSHNTDRFDIILYTNNAVLAQGWSGQVRPILKEPKAVANQMLLDEVDILITMSNHSSVLELLALRPAALQGSWLCTTRSLQLPYLDFVIADRNLIPLDERDDWSEHVLELPLFAPYEVSNHLPDIQDVRDEQYIVFGVFQKRSKITHRMMQTWSKILKQVPGSKLKLRDTAFTDPHVNRAVMREALASGIANDRIELIAISEDAQSNLSFYDDIDICLDCFPFGGGIDVMKTLWMGIPVVTQTGEFFASRISGTYLRHIGQESWIAKNSEEYIQIAVKLAQNRKELTAFQKDCRTTLSSSLATQSGVLTTLLESRLNQIYKAAQKI